MLRLCGSTFAFILALSYSLQYYSHWASEAAAFTYLQWKRNRAFTCFTQMRLLKQWACSCCTKSPQFWCKKLYLCWNIYQYPSWIPVSQNYEAVMPVRWKSNLIAVKLLFLPDSAWGTNCCSWEFSSPNSLLSQKDFLRPLKSGIKKPQMSRRLENRPDMTMS